jgi:hypothetical protein
MTAHRRVRRRLTVNRVGPHRLATTPPNLSSSLCRSRRPQAVAENHRNREGDRPLVAAAPVLQKIRHCGDRSITKRQDSIAATIAIVTKPQILPRPCRDKTRKAKTTCKEATRDRKQQTLRSRKRETVVFSTQRSKQTVPKRRQAR